VVSGDQTEILRKGYWSSYNVPFYEEVSSIFIVDCVFKSCVLSILQKNSGLHFRQFPVTNETAFPEFPEKKRTTQSTPNFSHGSFVPFNFILE